MSTTTNTNSTVLYLILAAFAVVVVIIIVLAIKRREEVFEGEVIDKDIIENQAMNNYPAGGRGIMISNNAGIRHTYRIRVRTDRGKELNYPISEGMYEIIKIGDRVSKPKGTKEVTILSASPSVQSPPATPPQETPAPGPTDNTPPTTIPPAAPPQAMS